MSIIGDIIESTKAIIKGMSTTFAYIPREKWTVEYPDEPVTMQPRYRGQHLLHVDELGREKCVACFLCAAACPSDCIYIVAADDPRPPEERTGVDERYASTYNIDYGRCIFAFSRSLPKLPHPRHTRAVRLQPRRPPRGKEDLLTKQKQSAHSRVAFATRPLTRVRKLAAAAPAPHSAGSGGRCSHVVAVGTPENNRSPGVQEFCAPRVHVEIFSPRLASIFSSPLTSFLTTVATYSASTTAAPDF